MSASRVCVTEAFKSVGRTLGGMFCGSWKVRAVALQIDSSGRISRCNRSGEGEGVLEVNDKQTGGG